jgi:hypothetical protein
MVAMLEELRRKRYQRRVIMCLEWSADEKRRTSQCKVQKCENDGHEEAR